MLKPATADVAAGISRAAREVLDNILVLKKHGLITAGPDCTRAYVRHLVFIRNAEVQLKAIAADELSLIGGAVMAKTRERFEGGSAQAGVKVRYPEWEALPGKIDRIDPDWKR